MYLKQKGKKKICMYLINVQAFSKEGFPYHYKTKTISYMCDVDILKVTTFAFTTFWSLRHLPKRNFDKRLKKIHTKNKKKKNI